MCTIEIKIKKEPGYENIPLPEYQTPGSSGLDLYAAVNNSVAIEPGAIMLISTGIRIAIPDGYEGQVRPRSGLSLKHGIGVLNSPGTIDSDYRGIVSVLLFNFGKKRFIIRRGDRIAQLVISKYERVKFTVRDKLNESSRNSGGFGSTGSN
ncbi:MAG: dUTP diphosphatase [bacterium]